MQRYVVIFNTSWWRFRRFTKWDKSQVRVPPRSWYVDRVTEPHGVMMAPRGAIMWALEQLTEPALPDFETVDATQNPPLRNEPSAWLVERKAGPPDVFADESTARAAACDYEVSTGLMWLLFRPVENDQMMVLAHHAQPQEER